MMRRAVLPVLAAGCALFVAGPVHAFPTKPKTMVVRGRVTDTEGRPVADVPVRILATRRVAEFLTIKSQPAETEVAATRTSADGFYEMSAAKLRDYDFYYLRFHAPTGFDAVRFSPPEDVEITDRLAKRRPVVQDCTLGPAPGWDATRRLIELFGPDSPRGRIVRALGVPDRVEDAPSGASAAREVWWYDAAGIAYVIENGEVLERRAVTPRVESQAIARQ
jgi:hypothetical protein